MKTNEDLQIMYLDYINNFLTVEKFAEYYNLTIEQANEVIEQGEIKHAEYIFNIQNKRFITIHNIGGIENKQFSIVRGNIENNKANRDYLYSIFDNNFYFEYHDIKHVLSVII